MSSLAELLRTGKAVIKDREENAKAIGLSSDFLEGFREGVAEVIAALDGNEAAADILEALG